MISDADIQGFVAAVQAANDARFEELGYKWRETFGYRVGPRFVKVICQMPAQSSVHSFIERETGDIYMAATAKAPAKHARGNIANGVADLNQDVRVPYLR